jgi:TonB family protein
MLLTLVLAVSESRVLPGQEDQGARLASAPPARYPLTAKAAGIVGKVILKAVIGKDGTMQSLRVIKGPNELRQAALDAVAKWKYHPYLQNGVPVAVETTITVNFTLGDKKQKAEAQSAAQAELDKASSESHPPPAQNPQN